jgi:hypothetical protein
VAAGAKCAIMLSLLEKRSRQVRERNRIVFSHLFVAGKYFLTSKTTLHTYYFLTKIVYGSVKVL